MSLDLQWWGRLAGLLAVEATLVVAIAWLAARWLRSPQMQRAVWQAALLGIALLWVAELAGARGQLARWLPAERPRRTLSVRVLDAPHTEPVTEPFLFEPTEAPLPTVTPPRSVWWPGWLWLAGLTLLTGRLALSRAWLMWCVWRSHGGDSGTGQRASGSVRSQKAVAPRCDASALQDADACSAAPDDTGAMVARLRRQLGLRRLRLLVWPRLRGPVAFGVLRPTVALPEDFRTRFSPAQCEAMLAHELAHLAARDPQWLTLADLVCALAWWHPAVWWARRQFRSACESAADEAAALVPDGRAALAESLVTFGRELASPRWARGIGVAGDGLKSQLARRVKVLLHASDGWCAVRPARMWATRLGATGVVAALVLAPWPGVNGAGLVPLLAAVKAAERTTPSGAESQVAAADKTKPLATVSDVLRDPQFRAVVDGLAAAGPSRSAQSELPAPGAIAEPKPREMTNAFVSQSGLGLFDHMDLELKRGRITVGFLEARQRAAASGPVQSASMETLLVEPHSSAYVQLHRSDEAAAQTLMQDSVRLMEAGQFDSAEARFRAAQHLAPSNEIDVLGDSAAPETDEAAAQKLIQDGVRRMEARQFDSAEARFRAALYLAPSDALANHYLALNRANRDTPVPASQPKPKPVSTERDRISAKLQEIVLPEVDLPPGTLGEAVRQLQDLARRHDPEKRGMNFLIKADDPVPSIDPATGQPFADRPDLDKTIIRLNGVLHDVTLGAALSALTNASATPVAWSVEDHAVVFHRPTMVTLYTRIFRVPATEFRGQLTLFLPPGETNLAVAIRAFCATNGVSFPPIAGRGAGGEGTATPPSEQKAVFFNDAKGLLFVRATVEDLDRIEHAIQSLDLPADDFLRRDEAALQVALQATKQADLDAASVFSAQGKDSPQAAQATERYRDAKERVQLFEQILATDKELGSLRTRYKDGHPKVREALARRSELSARIKSSAGTTTLPSAPTWAAATPQIALEVQFAEITERGSDDLGLDWLFGQSPTNNPALQSGPATNLLTEPGSPSGQNLRVDLLRTEGQSATLTKDQFVALRKRLEDRAGVEFLTTPKILTESGRQARISVGDARTIVSGVGTTQGSATNQAGINYQTEQIATGPSVDLVGTVEGGTTRLAIVAKVTEFLGYDQPKPGQEVKAASPGGKPVKGVMPLPHLRVRSTQADVSAGAGETVVLRGPLVSDTVRMVDKVVGLGDLPLLGRLFRTESTNNVRKRLYVFVTPTRVSATGERQ